MRKYEEDVFNEEYEKGYRAGRRQALREMEEDKPTMERRKDKMERRNIVKSKVESIYSDVEDIEKILRYYSRLSDDDNKVWRHAYEVLTNIKALANKL